MSNKQVATVSLTGDRIASACGVIATQGTLVDWVGPQIFVLLEGDYWNHFCWCLLLFLNAFTWFHLAPDVSDGIKAQRSIKLNGGSHDKL